MFPVPLANVLAKCAEFSRNLSGCHPAQPRGSAGRASLVGPPVVAMGRMGQVVTGSLAGLKPGRSDGDEQEITTPIRGVKEETMTRPPLTIALSSVLAAAIDGAG